MKIYLVQEFSRADYDFSTDIKHHGLYVNRNEAVTKAQDIFENLKQEYAEEFDKYECDDGEVEFDIDDDKGWYEFTFGIEEDFELFRVTVEEIELCNEDHAIYRKYKRDCLIEDIKSKAKDLGIDLTGKDIEKIATKADRSIENNEGLWESYWMSIEYVIEDI